MKTPYSHVHAIGDYVFAARGGAIHTFSIVAGTHISSWKHPDTEKQAVAVAENDPIVVAEEVKEDVEMESAPPASDEPPAKRQKLEENGEAKVTDEGQGDGEDAQDQQKTDKKKGKKAKNRSKGGDSAHLPQAPEKPLVVLITSTEDGKHVIAVSGHDKTIWVFEHDGEGNLSQLSQRKMPKRPIDLVIGPNNTIIAADKFGDVYSLPLLFDPSAQPAKPAPSLSAPKSKPSATTLTVHSKRNRIALEAQLQMYEAQSRNGGSKDEANADGPNFEMDLLLGHVSMLTAVLVIENEGRRYILTADRDEHIRVSRYIPQTHVIEGFCLGHKEFIASMVCPSGRNDILVSGGGDSDLFVWDWKKGAKLSSTSVLSLAQVVAPEVTKVAVSSLATFLYPTDKGSLTYIVAICEDIKAVFAWQLTEDSQLNHPSAIQIPGNPLHLTISPSPAASSSSPRIIIALDPSVESAPAKSSLYTFTLTTSEGRVASENFTPFDDETLSVSEAEVTEKEIRALLYTTEQLRKQEYVNGEEEEPVPEIEAEGSAAATAAKAEGPAE